MSLDELQRQIQKNFWYTYTRINYMNNVVQCIFLVGDFVGYFDVKLSSESDNVKYTLTKADGSYSGMNDIDQLVESIKRLISERK